MHLSSRLLSSCYLSLCLSVSVSVYPLAVSALSVYLPTCSPIRRVHICAVFPSLCIPSLAFCMRCAYGSAFCLSVPCGPPILIDDWKIYWDQSAIVAAGSAPTLLSSQHKTVAFNTHNCCQATHVHTTHTHLLACTKIKCLEEAKGFRGQWINQVCMCV